MGSGLLLLLTLAAEPRPDPGTYVEQRHLLGHELNLSFATYPLDPYDKSIGGALAWAWHPTELWGIEIARVALLHPLPTDLGEALGDRPQLRLLGGPSLMFKPFAGRIVGFMEETLDLGLLALLGPIGALTQDGDAMAGVSLGGGARIYLGWGLSARFDIKNNWLFPVSDGLESRFEMELTAGLSWGSG